MVEKGEVYIDHVFDEEVVIIEVGDGEIVVDDHIEEEPRPLPRWHWEHNERVGRFEKLRDGEDVEVQEVAENDAQDGSDDDEPKGILDY